jgi:glycine cleavage system H protein
MANIQSQFKDWALTGLFLLVAVVSLPLVAVLFFLGRMVFLAAALVGLAGGVVLYLLNPRFRAWFNNQTAAQIHYKGLRLATDVAIAPTHCWARIRRNAAILGADDFVQAILGPVESVETPPVGSRIRRGDMLFRLWRGQRSIELPAPLSGTVLGTNDALRSRPQMVNREPFSGGWTVRLRRDESDANGRSLLRGIQAQKWFRGEVDRLIAALAPPETSVASLADGGALIDGLHHLIDEDTWQQLKKRFLQAESTVQTEV